MSVVFRVENTSVAHHRKAIVDQWVEMVISGYPEKTGEFLRGQTDRFSNPVGAGLKEGLDEIVDGLVSGIDPSGLKEALDGVIRIRAVQDMSPAEAVGFVFDLKTIIAGIRDGDRVSVGKDEIDLDVWIDRLALQAFDVYMTCREQMWSIRAREIRNQSLGVLERMQAWRERRAEESENTSR